MAADGQQLSAVREHQSCPERLDSPIEIRFYVVDRERPRFLQAFAGRVDQLLSECRRGPTARLR